MPRRAILTNRPEIMLDATLPLPLYKQLYERLRGEILAGQLERGARLPSTRTLASELGVARTTTVLAYQQLLLEGYLESRVGQGTVVARSLPATLLNVQTDRTSSSQTDAGKTSPIHLASCVHPLKDMPYPKRIEERDGGAFRGGEPALDLFPYEIWARLIARRARQSLREFAHYQPPAGYYPLREAIAAQVGITRGVRCTPEQIILTAGSQGAFDLAVRTLLNPGEAVWLENPGYFGARGAFLAAGARLVPVPVDKQGLVVEIGRQRAQEARLVSTTPSHQFPTGVTMSLGRRLALLDWARQNQAWIIEDDYDSEFRYGGPPLTALQGMDGAGRVAYVGTFSKILFPGLRTGYLVAPEPLLEKIIAVRARSDRYPPVLTAAPLTALLNEGHFAAHLRRMRRRVEAGRDALVAVLKEKTGGQLDVHVPDQGLHLVARLHGQKHDSDIVQAAKTGSIGARALSPMYLNHASEQGLVLGFSGFDPAVIRDAARRLCALL